MGIYWCRVGLRFMRLALIRNMGRPCFCSPCLRIRSLVQKPRGERASHRFSARGTQRLAWNPSLRRGTHTNPACNENSIGKRGPKKTHGVMWCVHSGVLLSLALGCFVKKRENILRVYYPLPASVPPDRAVARD